jgi:hypothetical protein
MNWVGEIGVRPESTRLSRKPLAQDGRPATVEATSFLGNCVHVEARLASGERVVSEVPASDADFRRGDPVHVWWRRTDELRLP